MVLPSLRLWGWLAGLSCLATVALIPAAPAAASSLASGQPTPCHANHCHGPEVCGGGWKDYREPSQAEASGASADEACATAANRLLEQAKAQAADRCLALHPCGSCPEGCSGCQSERPAGRIDEAGARRTVEPQPDGSQRCVVETETVYRCRCGGCKKLGG